MKRESTQINFGCRLFLTEFINIKISDFVGIHLFMVIFRYMFHSSSIDFDVTPKIVNFLNNFLNDLSKNFIEKTK